MPDLVHSIYRTTNLITDKYYIGVHSSEDPNDSYLGSGKNLLMSLRKYGRENFEKEVLATFPTRELAFELKEKLVTNDLVNTEECYNCQVDGTEFPES